MYPLTISPYTVNVASATRYEFNSVGPKGTILKGVEITPLERRNIYNFGFGDVLPDGTIDDISETNNKDIIKVFATIIEIMQEYLRSNPPAILFFQGSTDQRTKVYQYVLQRYHEHFSGRFTITAISGKGNINQEVMYDPHTEEQYLAFLIRRK
jgi:hypothetical protein